MALYRKKPVVVEVWQWKKGALNKGKGVCGGGRCFRAGNTVPHLHTIHKDQLVVLEDGDWVLPEPDGIHFYPCKPDIFEATYEKVEKD